MPTVSAPIHPNVAAVLRAEPLFQKRLAGRETGRFAAKDAFVHETAWIAITGTSSSGKSTLIAEFAKRGYPVRREAATAYFEEQAREGRSIKDLFADRESSAATTRAIEHKQFVEELDFDLGARIFLDRGLPDQFFFTRKYGMDVAETMRHSAFHHYAKVFILDRLPYVKADNRVEHQTGMSDEDIERDLREMDEALERDYRALGYEPIRVPVMPVQDRIQFILQALSPPKA